MSRVKIEIPEHFVFSTEIQVRISDINYGGHLGNDAVLSVIHEARLRFLKSFGYDELNFKGVSLIMSDCMISFKAEAFYGDMLKVEVTPTNLHKLGFDLIYLITNKETQKTIAEAKTGMICFDYNTRKVKALPENAFVK